MIDESVLDEILPIPDKDELKESLQAELKDEGFVVTNFATGGIFYTLLMIVIQIRIELVKLLRTVLNNMFLRHAVDKWLELKAADFFKERKQPVKTKGYVTLARSAPGEVVRIAKGDIFKTDEDINGEELRYLAVSDVVIPAESLTYTVLAEAETAGSKYNVPVGQIKKSLVHIEGIETITNEAGWIVQEGSDLEDIESFRERTLNSWAELSTMPIADKYKNVSEAVPGVLFVRVDDMHPRGQGTIDIIVTSTAGAASEGLLALVLAEAEKIKGPYDNLLVKSSEVVVQDLAVELWVPDNLNTDGLVERAQAIITDLFMIKKSRKLNELLHSNVSYALKKNIPSLENENVKVITPATDLILGNDKVIILGNMTISIVRV